MLQRIPLQTPFTAQDAKGSHTQWILAMQKLIGMESL